MGVSFHPQGATMNTTTRPIAILALAAFASAATAHGPSAVETLFEEDFSNYGETAAGVTPAEGISVNNDPIWTCTADLSVRPKADFRLYEKPIALGGPDAAAAGGGFDLRFDFLLDGVSAERPGGFDLLLGDGAKSFAIPVAADLSILAIRTTRPTANMSARRPIRTVPRFSMPATMAELPLLGHGVLPGVLQTRAATTSSWGPIPSRAFWQTTYTAGRTPAAATHTRYISRRRAQARGVSPIAPPEHGPGA